MAISTPRHVDAWSSLVAAAADSAGLKMNPDYNSGVNDGLGSVQSNIRDGSRHSVLDGYLNPALGRKNLTVVTGARVDKIQFEGTTATGVEVSGSVTGVLKAQRAVVLTAGALRSPQILLRSGVGPVEHLREAGVRVVHDLPGVGQNLQDHPLITGAWTTTLPIGGPGVTPERQYELLRRGPLSTNFQISAWHRLAAEALAPDVQFSFVSYPVSAGGEPRTPTSVIVAVAMLLNPHSRGQVKLRSADPAERPWVDLGILSDDRDLRTLAEGLNWLREKMFRETTLAEHVGEPIRPPADSDMDAYVRENATSSWHFAGTCRIGDDPHAVVRPDLAVHGLQGLYVADASVMPTVPRGNPQAPTIMIAERAATFIRFSS
ncbi:hypothetical protein GCM10022223_33000 [Kineosporia mesophila]|uniref:Glucose-methanol-choline oxidoreductase N-terminal domain-containing protein n=2 Tax=Kineosporia mesophila TaxID=566012 RepID=A0ABP6ZPT0_9ACTN